MKRLLIIVAALLVAAPALAQSVGEKTGVNSMLGMSPSTDDFVKQVAISDMFEIESNKLAQAKGNAEEKSFASQMVADHSKTTAELKSLVSGGKVKADCRRRSTARTRASSTSLRTLMATTSAPNSTQCR